MAERVHYCALPSQAQSFIRRTNVLIYAGTFVGMAKRPDAKDIFIANLKEVMRLTGMKPADLSRVSGISVRHIHYILTGDRIPSLEVADQIAEAFGLSGYHLQMPSFKLDVIKNGAFDRILHAYKDIDAEGRRLMENQAEYLLKRAEPTVNDSKKPGTEKEAKS